MRTQPPGSPTAWPASGWYPDPHQPSRHRYWDGHGWTAHTVAPQPASFPSGPTWPASTAASKTDGFAIASLVFGLLGGPVLSVIFGVVARSRIKRAGGTLKGRGMATAGIVLGSLWTALILVGVILAFSGGLEEHHNVDEYTSGEEHEIAALIDRFEQALDDEDAAVVCQTLLTAELRELFDEADGCSDVFSKEGVQFDLEIRDLEVQGATARAVVDEFGDALTLSFRKVDGRWRIDDMSE